MSETVDSREGETEEVTCGTSFKRSNSGMAAIKPEFIHADYKPRLVTAYLPEETVEEIQQMISQREKAGSDQNLVVSEPPSKKAKLKGRNKKRPMEKRPCDAQKLCPSIIGQRTCTYGDRCKFSHDVAKFVLSRPKSIGEKCYVFETYGYCPYGVTCLFSEHHKAAAGDMTSVANEAAGIISKNVKPNVKNIISKDQQIRLRKKEYNFKRANKVVRQFQSRRKEVQMNSAQKTSSSVVVSDKSDDLEKTEENEALNKVGVSGEPDVASEEKRISSEKVESIENQLQNTGLVREMVPADCSETLKPRGGPALEMPLLRDHSENTVCPSNSHATCIAMEDVAVGECDPLESELKCLETSNESAAFKPMPAERIGMVTDEDFIKPRMQEKKKIDFRNKLYLAPLTTVGNLPFRRLCKKFGADITCGEMAMSSNLLQGQASEWALMKRHESENLFGAQLCGSFPDTMTRAAQVIHDTLEVDFIDINIGCPIDIVVQKGEGCAVMGRTGRLEDMVYGMSSVIDIPLTVKMRTGLFEDKNIAHTLLPKLRQWDVSMVTVHGRSREQRYTKLADWNYVKTCVDVAKPMNVFGNGDILSYVDYNDAMEYSGAAGCMIARGALIKPWLFTEIKEQRHWDISASERLDFVRDYVNYGLEHWGSDQQGVANTRRFLLEWLSFFHRYIPVGILERVPQRINEKPPHYFGRNDLETLMASPNCADWIKLSEMFLGPVPDGFTFLPKHRANAYR